MKRRSGFLACFALLLATLNLAACHVEGAQDDAPKVDRPTQTARAAPVTAPAASPTEELEHLLRVFVKPTGVNYRGIHDSPGARRTLERFLTFAAEMPPETPQSNWINTYNTLVLNSIVKRYPLKTVKDVPGFFDSEKHTVAGKKWTLDTLEAHIRSRFGDPRMHFAFNCGARSCPRLFPFAFRERTLDATLEHLTRTALSDDGYMRYANGEWHVSAILHWYRSDFEKDSDSLADWITRYAPADRTQGLGDGTTLGRLPFDWELNDASAVE